MRLFSDQISHSALSSNFLCTAIFIRTYNMLFVNNLWLLEFSQFYPQHTVFIRVNINNFRKIFKKEQSSLFPQRAKVNLVDHLLRQFFSLHKHQHINRIIAYFSGNADIFIVKHIGFRDRLSVFPIYFTLFCPFFQYVFRRFCPFFQKTC